MDNKLVDEIVQDLCNIKYTKMDDRERRKLLLESFLIYRTYRDEYIKASNEGPLCSIQELYKS